MVIKKNSQFSVIVSAVCLLVFTSCTNDAESNFKTKMDSAKADDNGPGELLHQSSFEVTAEGDTINRKDQYGLKQGIWITNTGILLANGGVKKDTAFYKDGIEGKK